MIVKVQADTPSRNTKFRFGKILSKRKKRIMALSQKLVNAERDWLINSN